MTTPGRESSAYKERAGTSREGSQTSTAALRAADLAFNMRFVETVFGLALAIAVLSWLMHSTDVTIKTQLYIVTIIVGCVATWSMLFNRQSGKRNAFFAPHMFPMLYVAVSFLGPVWWIYVGHNTVNTFIFTSRVSPATPALMGISVLSFIIGTWVPRLGKARRGPRVERMARSRSWGSAVSPGRLAFLSRLLGVTAIALMINTLLTVGVAARGQNQVDNSAADTVSVLQQLLPLTATLGMALSSKLAQRTRLLPPVDWFLIVALALTTGALGNRNGAISVLIAILIIASFRGKLKIRSLTLALLIGALFMVQVLHYRNTQAGRSSDVSAIQSLFGDLAPAAYTTGSVANSVPMSFPYQHGSTFIAAFIRLAPSPITNSVFGPTRGTGVFVFRNLINSSNPNSGVGFSLPAEGYLNFGIWGMVGVCFFLGFLVASIWSRAEKSGSALSMIAYAVIVATLPIGLRSDALGLVKGFTYPLVLIIILLLMSRTRLKSKNYVRSTT